MKKYRNFTTHLISLLFFTMTVAAAESDVLTGTADASPRWGSGWLVLDEARGFLQGSKLRLHIGGGAQKVKIRLLPKGADPNTRSGMLPGVFDVQDGIVEITLDSTRRNVEQISVHGGPNPWGKYPLGGGNGPATLEQATLISAN